MEAWLIQLCGDPENQIRHNMEDVELLKTLKEGCLTEAAVGGLP